MELLTLAALGAGGYWLYTKARSSQTVHPFQPVTGGVTKKPWKTRVIGIEGSGEQKKTTVEVWAPAGAWGPHLDLLVTTYQQTGSDKNSRVTLGTGPDALAAMVTAAGQDFAIKKSSSGTTVSGQPKPEHVFKVYSTRSGKHIGNATVYHDGQDWAWHAQGTRGELSLGSGSASTLRQARNDANRSVNLRAAKH